MFNKVIFAGSLTKDPEVRYTPSGTAVTTLRIAVNSKVKQNEKWQDEVLFIDVIVFGAQAEACGQYLNKGSSVLVEGRLRERTWESEGKKRTKMEVLASTTRFLSKSSNGNSKNVSAPDEVTELEPF